MKPKWSVPLITDEEARILLQNKAEIKEGAHYLKLTEEQFMQEQFIFRCGGLSCKACIDHILPYRWKKGNPLDCKERFYKPLSIVRRINKLLQRWKWEKEKKNDKHT